MSNDLSHQRHKGSIGPGPGPKLKAARIKAGLEIAEIAAQLRLRKRVVEDLENNNYETLPASVFVQGYYRNMAEALGLPKDEVVQAYFQAINLNESEPAREPGPIKAPPAEPKPAPEARQEGGKGFMGRLTTGIKTLGSRTDAQQETREPVQDLSQPRPAPKARPLPSSKHEAPEPATQAPARPKAETRTESRPDTRVEPTLELDEEPAAYDEAEFEPASQPAPKSQPRPEPRTEPRSFRPGPRPQRQATHLNERNLDPDNHAETPRSFRPRGGNGGLPLPRISLTSWLPQNPGRLLRRIGLTLAVLAVIGLAGWGISLIPMRGLVDDMMSKWSALIDSPQQGTPTIPPQLAEDEDQLEPMAPSADTQLLEPPPLSDSLLDFENNLNASPEEAEEPAAQEPQAPAKKGNHKIIVELKGVSWVEIEDATKEYRLVGELAKDSVHELKGSPPYKVLFGRGNLVKLTVDGKNFDFSKYQQGSVARFTLDP